VDGGRAPAARKGCHFEWAGLLAEAVQLGHLAIRCGKPLEWDAAKGKFTHDPEANRFVEEPYHNGWSLDKV